MCLQKSTIFVCAHWSLTFSIHTCPELYLCIRYIGRLQYDGIAKQCTIGSFNEHTQNAK